MRRNPRAQAGVGLMEVMISIVISMLLVLVIYQVYEISEGQKRTITAGSDAQQNASYSMYVLGRDLSMAGNGIASAADSLDTCTQFRPLPVMIQPGASDNDPDTITVFYGGSSSLSTSIPFNSPATGAQPYVVRAPIAFSQGDVIVAKEGANCTLSTINAGGVSVDANGFATIAHTPMAGNMGVTYGAVNATLVNLGQAAAMGRVEYTVDATNHVLRSQNLLPNPAAPPPPSPIVNDIVNLKAQYGVDANCDGVLVWTDPVGAWSPANLLLPLPLPPGCTPGTPSIRQMRAVRVAIVTRSTQFEKDVVTPQYPNAMPSGKLGMFCDPAPTCEVSMNLSADDQHYRYKVLETIVPLRNALWNSP